VCDPTGGVVHDKAKRGVTLQPLPSAWGASSPHLTFSTADAAQWRLTGGGTQMPFSAMWTHIRVWNLRVRGHTGRFFLQSYVKRTSGAVSTLTTEGRSSSRRDASGAIKKCVLVAPES